MLWYDNKAFSQHRQDTQASCPLQLLINAFLVLWVDDYIHLPLIENTASIIYSKDWCSHFVLRHIHLMRSVLCLVNIKCATHKVIEMTIDNNIFSSVY